MRLATVFDKDANEARPVFELPSGRRVELRELFRSEPIVSTPHSPSVGDVSISEDELAEIPLYFTDLAKTVEFLDDVIDAVRQWSRDRAERPAPPDAAEEISRIDRMPFLPPVPVVRSFREFDAFEQHAKSWCAAHDLTIPRIWYEAPLFSFASPTSLYGHEQPVHRPMQCEELDYGLQIAAIVGRGGRNIKARDAWKHIAGFTIINSFVARDIERREVMAGGLLNRGKSRDFATAVGPYLVSLNSLRDRIDADDRLHLAMRALVNSRELSRADAATMHFTWPQIIEQASRDADLFPGDLISGGVVGTGSVLDLGGQNAAPWLKPGDVVELEIERLGVLRTPIIDRSANGSPAAPATGAAATQATLAV